MKVLVAEDEAVSRRVLEAQLTKWGYEVCQVRDGDEAWAELQRPDAPRLAILDWMMPGIDGIEVCRRVRALLPARPIHIIVLTVKDERDDVVAGLEAGADDYLTKPFDPKELRARVRVGARIALLQNDLEERVAELEAALHRVKRLQGLLPICAYCKKIRDDQNYWHEVEGYIRDHSEARFTHGICPGCYVRVMDEVKTRGESPPDTSGEDE